MSILVSRLGSWLVSKATVKGRVKAPFRALLVKVLAQIKNIRQNISQFYPSLILVVYPKRARGCIYVGLELSPQY